MFAEKPAVIYLKWGPFVLAKNQVQHIFPHHTRCTQILKQKRSGERGSCAEQAGKSWLTPQSSEMRVE